MLFTYMDAADFHGIHVREIYQSHAIYLHDAARWRSWVGKKMFQRIYGAPRLSKNSQSGHLT